MPRPEFRSKDSILSSIIRVDHAGEYGAMRIYSGQIDACKYRKNTSDIHLLEEMLEQEKHHLSYFTHQMNEKSIRPTALMPFWHVAGYMLGFVTRIIGPKMAMLCTEAVEDVIDKHYEEQLEYLKSQEYIENDLTSKIAQYRLEELEHKNIAINNGSRQAPMYLVARNIIKQICKSAISASKVI